MSAITPEESQQIAEKLTPFVRELQRRALELEAGHQSLLEGVPVDSRASAKNLLHYLALRQIDLRHLQQQLAVLGLSSLSGMEPRVLCTLNAVLRALHMLAGEYLGEVPEPPVNFITGPGALEHNTRNLLGAVPGKRYARIMATMPAEAADDYEIVRAFVAAGMDVMRIDCSQGNEKSWVRMAVHLREAERELGRSCRVYADLAGPMLRTGPIRPDGRIRKVRPARNSRGETLAPSLILLVAAGSPEPEPSGVQAVIPVTADLIRHAEAGFTLSLSDAREKPRDLKIVSASGLSCIAEAHQTVYFETGMRLELKSGDAVVAEGAVGELPEIVRPLELSAGQTLVLLRPGQTGAHEARDDRGMLLEPACIPCSLDAVFDAAEPGERVFFDDGRIGGRIIGCDSDRITVEITRTPEKGGKLRPDREISLPDTNLRINALSPKDLRDLDFAASHADMIGLSFVRTKEDVFLLQNHLEARRAGHLGIVLKIGSQKAYENLPHLLLAGFRSPSFGVMVSRSALAVETGFERLPEVQEEILWVCEAAHVPVILDDRTFESHAWPGTSFRAEACGQAECVMLDRGPRLCEAVQFLNGVLARTESRHARKHNLLRRLSIAQIE